MNWQRLDRESTLKIIDSVKASGDAAGLFSPATSEVQKARLAFYNEVDLYKLTNFASLPSFTFEYLGNGEFFQYLDGTELPIYTTNDKGHLALDARSVVDYLEFFFLHVQLDEEESYLIRDPRDMPLLNSLDSVSREAVIRNHSPVEVSYDAGYDRHTVHADLYSDGLLLRAAIDVTSTGRVSIQSRKMIVNAIAQSDRSGIMA